jgi:hypothetical protein
VIYFNGAWHYCSPVGAPQEGSYHYTSSDGLTFAPQAIYPSDNTHNWTGNYLLDGNSTLRFYGSGPQIWYNTSPDGFTWSGYISTNVQGGDPTVMKLSSTNYLLIFVGQPYQTGVEEYEQPGTFALFQNYPNPFNPSTTIRYALPHTSFVTLTVYNTLGQQIAQLVNQQLHGGSHDAVFRVDGLAGGVYLYRIQAGSFSKVQKMVLMK